jgi:hypothetical protein
MQSKPTQIDRVTDMMHVALNHLATQLGVLGTKYGIKDLADLGDDRRYADGGELRPQYQGSKNARPLFYGNFNSTARSNQANLLIAAKLKAKSQSGYAGSHQYWCEDRGSHGWTPHLADETKNEEKPALDHIEEVGSHWNRIGHNQTQAEREDWFNDTSNHQVICTHHNSSKKGPNYTNLVGPNFKGPGE